MEVNPINDDEIQQVIGKLKFISKIGCNKKVDVKNLRIYDDSFFLSITRTILSMNFFSDKKESRNCTLKFIKDTINSGISLCSKCLESNSTLDNKLGIVILDCLLDCEAGIKNMMNTTYKNDAMFVSELEALIVYFKQKFSELKDYSTTSIKK